VQRPPASKKRVIVCLYFCNLLSQNLYNKSKVRTARSFFFHSASDHHLLSYSLIHFLLLSSLKSFNLFQSLSIFDSFQLSRKQYSVLHHALLICYRCSRCRGCISQCTGWNHHPSRRWSKWPHIHTKQHHRCCRYRYRILLLPKGMPISFTSNPNQANTTLEPHRNTVLLRRSLPPPQHQRRLKRLLLWLCPHSLLPLGQHFHHHRQRHHPNLVLLRADHREPLPIRHGRLHQRAHNGQQNPRCIRSPRQGR
jgi:hypothetical protein